MPDFSGMGGDDDVSPSAPAHIVQVHAELTSYKEVDDDEDMPGLEGEDGTPANADAAAEKGKAKVAEATEGKAKIEEMD